MTMTMNVSQGRNDHVRIKTSLAASAFRILSVIGVTALVVSIPFNGSAQSQEVPDYLKDLQNDYKPSKPKTKPNECKATFATAAAWLNDGAVTRKYKEETERIIAKWDTLISKRRFGVKDQINRSSAAKKKFEEFASNLYTLARDVAIDANPKCEECLLLNDWSYLGYLSVEGDNRIFELGNQSVGALTDSKNENVNLENLTDLHVADVKSDIVEMKLFASKIPTALASTRDQLDNLLQLACPTLSLDEIWDNTKSNFSSCASRMLRKCREDNYKNSNAYCRKKDLQFGLKRTFDGMIAKLKTNRSGGTLMTSLKNNICSPKNVGDRFEWIRWVNMTKKP